jgi:hypothetical protein
MLVSPPGAMLAGFEALSADEVDAALVGLIGLADPLAREVDETWIAAPRWREAARALLGHRRRGRELGDLLTVAAVLVEDTALHLPQTMAADAILAALDTRPVVVFIERARTRAARLRLHRAAQSIETIAHADIQVLPQHVERVQAELAAVLADCVPAVPARPSPPPPASPSVRIIRVA